MKNTFPELTADEAAALIANGETIGFSGFTPAGAVKSIPRALAAKAMKEHEAGRDFKVGMITGASTGPSLDGEMARADAVLFRTPYQSDRDLRNRINKGETRFFDMHLSLLPQWVRYGFLGPINWAVVEACGVSSNGEVVLTTSVGASPTFLSCADKVLIELNGFHPTDLRGFHDIYEPKNPPHRKEIPVYGTADRIGSATVKVDPKKIVGIVRTNEPDEGGGFSPESAVTEAIGHRVADFLAREMAMGRIPPEFLPVQSGVGNVANAVLGALASHPDIPPFSMYSEVIQDSVVAALRSGRIKFASGTSITVSPDVLVALFDELDMFRDRIVLRPQEISNNPEVIRRIGILSVNTALEVDIFGNVNSTHVMGKDLMNGIGGSGDFTRNAYISIFTCPSTAKGGAISAIVPLVTHLDHSEHSVQVIVTEQGTADLRGKDPSERAKLIIDNCAHPEFRDELYGYLNAVEKGGHTPQTLSQAYAMHQQFMQTGNMRGVNWTGAMTPI